MNPSLILIVAALVLLVTGMYFHGRVVRDAGDVRQGPFWMLPAYLLCSAGWIACFVFAVVMSR